LLKIVVTFAVHSEFASWRRLSGFERVKRRGVPMYRRRNGGADICAVMTGIGTRTVQAELRELLAASVDVCIVSGLAGSLRKQHQTRSVLVARAIRGGAAGKELKSDKSLVEIANRCGAIEVDSFLTSLTVVNSPAEKQRLGEIADAVDMESFQIFSQAREFGVPAVAVRAVSDAAETNVPIDFNQVIGNRGEIGWVAALLEIAKAPARLPQLIRFGIESSRAAHNLALFLERFTNSLIADFFSHGLNGFNGRAE
jgi:purine-nucleoside phosphorylase